MNMAKKTYKIAYIPGDGIGIDVGNEGVKVLKVAAEKADFGIDLVNYDFGAARYLKTGELVPDSAIEELRKVDSIFLGAIGHPDVKTGILEKGILLKIRFDLDQYINLRPVKLYPGVETPIKNKGPEDINFVVVRENTEGIYLGMGGIMKKDTPDEVAIQEMVNTRKGVERCIRYAFDFCQKAGRKKVTLVDKSNVLTYAHDLWQRCFADVKRDYPDIETNHTIVDATTMWFVKNPEWFDVIVTSNMFGDIITDLGAMIQGGMGIAAGGNLNPEGVSMFEPIHGSAPKHAGKGTACPLAAIASVGMMLEELGEVEIGRKIDRVIGEKLGDGTLKGATSGTGQSCSEMGDIVAAAL